MFNFLEYSAQFIELIFVLQVPHKGLKFSNIVNPPLASLIICPQWNPFLPILIVSLHNGQGPEGCSPYQRVQTKILNLGDIISFCFLNLWSGTELSQRKSKKLLFFNPAIKPSATELLSSI